MPRKDKAQRSAYGKQYREKNRARINAQKQVHYAENRELILAKDKAYYEANKEDILARKKARIEADPTKVAANQARWAAKNTAKLKAYRRKWYAANKQKVQQYGAAWQKANPDKIQAQGQRRRAAKRGATRRDFTAAQWKAMQEAFDHRCAYCNKRCKGRLTQDHITPISKGGQHTAFNIVPACLSCNSRKHDLDILCPVQPLLIVC